jgi:hypothetical protein
MDLQFESTESRDDHPHILEGRLHETSTFTFADTVTLSRKSRI